MAGKVIFEPPTISGIRRASLLHFTTSQTVTFWLRYILVKSRTNYVFFPVPIISCVFNWGLCRLQRPYFFFRRFPANPSGLFQFIQFSSACLRFVLAVPVHRTLLSMLFLCSSKQET